MSDEIVKAQSVFLAPAVTVKDALIAYQAKKDLIDGIMRPGVDYGVIPGTTKPTLLKAGAEKATSFFGLSPRFRDAQVIEDFTGKDHDGEPFFFYRRTCDLYLGDYLIASVDGSCNSFEKKYRYRSTERVCPQCGKSAIIKGKAEFGGGWVCFKKKDGCGAKFADNDSAITNQEVGQVKNPDVADQANTILKIADKRALVAATLIATGLSDYFTQDMEDFIQPSEYIEGSFSVSTPAAESVNQETGQIGQDVVLLDPHGEEAVKIADGIWNIGASAAAKELWRLFPKGSKPVTAQEIKDVITNS